MNQTLLSPNPLNKKVKIMTQPDKINNFYPGLEYLRIFFITLIVGWHTTVLGQSNFKIFNFSNFLYFCFFLLAVPMFFFISQFLYIHNRKKGYLTKRITYLLFFLIFWNLVSFVLFSKAGAYLDWVSVPFLIRGGYIGLYFILDLIILTLFTEIICSIGEKISSKIYETIIGIILVLFLAFSILTPFIFKPGSIVTDYLLGITNFIFFLPYSMAAFLLTKKEPEIKRAKKKKIVNKYTLLFLIGIGISVSEYFFYNTHIDPSVFSKVFPIYNRLSLFILAVTINSLFILIKKPINPIVKELAKLTSGVYIIHIILISILKVNFANIYLRVSNYHFIYFFMILAASFVLSWIIKNKKIL